MAHPSRDSLRRTRGGDRAPRRAGPPGHRRRRAEPAWSWLIRRARRPRRLRLAGNVALVLLERSQQLLDRGPPPIAGIPCPHVLVALLLGERHPLAAHPRLELGRPWAPPSALAGGCV